jgi:hypothetical protein
MSTPSTRAQVAALKLALLFHSAGPWTDERQAEWVDLIGLIECETGRGLYHEPTEATSRSLCDAIRAALSLEPEWEER